MSVAGLSCDVLVIGGGLAGVQAAEVASQFVRDVLVVNQGVAPAPPATLRDASVLSAYLAQDAGGVADWKSSRVSLGVNRGGGAVTAKDQGATPYQRGFAAYLHRVRDQGAYLGDPMIAEFTAAGIYNRIGWLESYGLHLVRTPDRLYRGFPGPGHDLDGIFLIEEPPGKVLARIWESAARFGVRRVDGLYVTKLLVDDDGVAGAYALEVSSGEAVVIEARAVVLATGGADRLYRDDEGGTAGDGYQLALDAGAELANMEFVAFGPEALEKEALPSGLLSVLLGLGGALQGADGSPVSRLPDARLTQDLARAVQKGPVRIETPPDVLARIADVAPFVPYLPRLKQPMEVHVTCRGLLGGVVHRVFATGVSGLFVAGAVATGCHGADLLPGLETTATLYSAENAASAAVAHSTKRKPRGVLTEAVRAEERRLAALRVRGPQAQAPDLRAMQEEVRALMWRGASLFRSAPDLEGALTGLKALRSRLDQVGAGTPAGLVPLLGLENLVATAELVSRAALLREETRGQHARTDFPATDDAGQRSWIAVARRGDALSWRRLPVPGQ